MSASASLSRQADSFVRPDKRGDHEFLAPALEVLETPPSPVKTALILIICAFVTVSLIWAYFGRLDIIAVAQGKVQPVGRTKIVQPLITGKVVTLPPANGTRVKHGQVLVVLDPAGADADVNEIAQTLASTRAEAARREVAIDAAQNGITLAEISWPSDTSLSNRKREERLLQGELMQLDVTLASLIAQKTQKEIQSERLQETINAQASLVSTLQDRVNMRSLLVDRSAGSVSSVLDATEVLKEQTMQLVAQKGQLAEASAGVNVLGYEINKVRRTFLAEQLDKLGAAERAVEELEQKLSKAKNIQDQMALVSPADGTIQASSITSIGQVVNSGQELMRIVPEGADIEIEVYVMNKDIGFIEVGQEAVVKLEAFPFTRYGTLQGVVSKVSTDAIPEPDAARLEGNPTTAGSGMFAGVERVQNLVFPVTVKLTTTTIMANDKAVPVSPGMATAVEIKTGDRRILEYVFSPLVAMGQSSLHER